MTRKVIITAEQQFLMLTVITTIHAYS